MPTLSNIIKISKANYNTLQGGGHIWKDGMQHYFDSQAVYLVEGGYTGFQGIQGLSGATGGTTYNVVAAAVSGTSITSDYSLGGYQIAALSNSGTYNFYFSSVSIPNLFTYTIFRNESRRDVTVTINPERNGLETVGQTSVVKVPTNACVEVSCIYVCSNSINLCVVTASDPLYVIR